MFVSLRHRVYSLCGVRFRPTKKSNKSPLNPQKQQEQPQSARHTHNNSHVQLNPPTTATTVCSPHLQEQSQSARPAYKSNQGLLVPLTIEQPRSAQPTNKSNHSLLDPPIRATTYSTLAPPAKSCNGLLTHNYYIYLCMYFFVITKKIRARDTMNYLLNHNHHPSLPPPLP